MWLCLSPLAKEFEDQPMLKAPIWASILIYSQEAAILVQCSHMQHSGIKQEETLAF